MNNLPKLEFTANIEFEIIERGRPGRRNQKKDLIVRGLDIASARKNARDSILSDLGLDGVYFLRFKTFDISLRPNREG